MTEELLALNQKLLDAIASGDWEVYRTLCADDLTAYEPEAPGQLIIGLDFHRFYFAPGGVKGRHQTTMSNPRVRLIGEAAIITYTRLVQRSGPEGGATMTMSTETRVWERRGGAWKHVHFHRAGV